MASRKQNTEVSRLSIDIGNGFCVAYDGETLRVIKSVYAPLMPSENPKDDSDIVVECNGERYVLGETASFYRNPLTLAEGNKAEMALFFILGLLPHDSTEQTYDLVLSVPDNVRYADSLRTKICGTHSWGRGYGVEFTTTLRVERTLSEGYGSYLASKRAGILFDHGYTVVVDIGAGTFCSLVIDNKTGRIVEQLASERAGVLSLASGLRDDNLLRKAIGDAPSVQLIFEGLENGTFEYGETGVNFYPNLQPRLKPWASNIIAQVRSQFSQHLPKVKTFLFTGGGAILLKDRISTNPLFKFAPSALTANCEGAFYAK